MINKHTLIVALLLCLFISLFFMHIDVSMDYFNNVISEENWWFKKFNFDKEKNFPSIFSTILLFIAAVILFLNYLNIKKSKGDSLMWIVLSFVFVFLSLDELLRIHEKLNHPLKEILPKVGIFHYAWVLPYLILITILGSSIIKPLFKLPKKTLYGFIASGIIFISGAVGMEMIAGNYIKNNISPLAKTVNSFQVFIYYTIEESLEMLGMICFIYFALNHLNKIITAQQ